MTSPISPSTWINPSYTCSCDFSKVCTTRFYPDVRSTGEQLADPKAIIPHFHMDGMSIAGQDALDAYAFFIAYHSPA